MAPRTPAPGGPLAEGLREARGDMTQVAAAEQLAGMSQPTIARLERGDQVPRPDQVTALLDVYATHHPIPPALRDRLMAAAADAQDRAYRVVLQSWGPAQKQVAQLEQDAVMIRGFTPIGMHGLLQTRDVVRAMFGDSPGGAHRLAAQALLDDPARRFRYIVTESGLGYSMPNVNHEVMADQVAHLSDLSTRPNIEIGVIPWGAPTTTIPVHSWEIYDEKQVCFGTSSGMVVVKRPRDVAPYLDMWSALDRVAVYGPAARRILDDTARRYRNHHSTAW